MTSPERQEGWTISGCSRCGTPLEPFGYDGDMECPGAQFPNKTRHGSYRSVELRVVAASVARDLADELAEVRAKLAVTLAAYEQERTKRI